jgi:hypothetical protein
MKTEGMKSRKEWTTDADTMHADTRIGTVSGSANPETKDETEGYETSIKAASVLT